MASSFINFIDCAALKIYALPEAEISVTNGIISKTLGIDDVFKIDMGVYSYIIYIQEKDFGTWTVVSTIGSTNRQKNVVINNFSLYNMSLILPNEYQQVEYIQSSGAQWINTGVSVNTENLRVKSIIMLTAVGTTNTGGGDAIWVGQWSTSGYALIRNGSNPGIIRWHSGGKYVDVTAQLNVWKTIETTKTSFIYDDKIYILNNPSGSDANKLLYLLWTSDTNGISPIEKARAKIKITKIYSGNTLIRDMYPCIRKSDSVPGMYDSVNDVFYTNSGSGSFTFGAPIDTKYSPLYLYNYGNNNLITTGGLQTYAYRINGSSAAVVPGILSKTNTNITFSHSSSSSVSTLFINNKIDLTNFSTIKINVTASQGTEFMLRTTLNKTNNYVTTANITKTGGTTGIIALDIASLTGEQYVFLAINGSSPSITFNDWWVE